MVNDSEDLPTPSDEDPIGFIKIPKEVRDRVEEEKSEQEKVHKILMQHHAMALLDIMIKSPLFLETVRKTISNYIDNDVIRNAYLDNLIYKLDKIAESLRVKTHYEGSCLDRDSIQKYFRKGRDK